MRTHGRRRSADVLGRIGGAQGDRIGQRQSVGDVAVQGIVRRRLVGQHVRDDTAAREFGKDVGGIRLQGDGACLAGGSIPVDPCQRLIERLHVFVDVPGREPALDTRRIDLDHQRDPFVHRHGERLGAAHAAESGGDDQATRESAAEVTPRQFGQRLVGALEDALRTYINPAARGHLAVHRQAAVLEIAKHVPGRPCRHEHRVRDDDARGPRMRPKDGDRFARLDDERFIVLEPAECGDNRVERLPRPGRAAGATIHDQFIGTFRYGRVQIVHQHSQCGFLRPSFAGDRGAARRADVAAERIHRRQA